MTVRTPPDGQPSPRGHRGVIAGERRSYTKEGVMYHPETMLRLARERQDQFKAEARHHETVRELTSTPRQEQRERFRIRDLRWSLFRPVVA